MAKWNVIRYKKIVYYNCIFRLTKYIDFVLLFREIKLILLACRIYSNRFRKVFKTSNLLLKSKILGKSWIWFKIIFYKTCWVGLIGIHTCLVWTAKKNEFENYFTYKFELRVPHVFTSRMFSRNAILSKNEINCKYRVNMIYFQVLSWIFSKNLVIL